MPCDRSGVVCEYLDTAKRKTIPRTYVIHLQDRVRELEDELMRLSEDDGSTADNEGIVRGAGLVKLDSVDEPRFLGTSSGIAVTRLVMELARRNTETKSIREIVPEVRERQEQSPEQDKQRIKTYPLTSSVLAPSLPKRSVTDGLIKVFIQKAQAMFPTLHEPTFQQDLEAVYNGSNDAYQNFVVRMVLAISMQKLVTQYAGLADSYYLAALPYLNTIVEQMDLKTIQCFVLIAQYSLLTPTKIPVYYLIGLATRMCQQLGLNEEKTVVQGMTELDPIQKDMRRRLFWIVTSMENGLSHSLGRPSAFAISADHLEVGFFEPVDDEYITVDGIKPGPPSPKKVITIHFFKMRLLQMEIRKKLYLKTKPEPKDDTHPWFAEMEEKLESWRTSSPGNEGGTGLSSVWFRVRYNTMIIFLYRPSPQIPQPSVRAAKLCFDAAVYNLQEQRKMVENRSVDLTWVFVQQIFMQTNTVLWTISVPQIREQHSKREVEGHLDNALRSLLLSSERWPGTAAATDLYRKLITATLKSYGEESEVSSVTYSESIKAPSLSPYPERPSQSPISTPSTTAYSVTRPPGSTPSYGYPTESPQSQPDGHSPQPNLSTARHPVMAPLSSSNPNQPLDMSQFQHSPRFQEVSYNTDDGTVDLFPYGVPDLLNWNPEISAAPPNASKFPSLSFDAFQFDALLSQQQQQQQQGPLGGFQYEYHPRNDSLSQEQQLELMDTLETFGVEYMDGYLEQSAAYFTSVLGNSNQDAMALQNEVSLNLGDA
ncbi:hypothetical protein GP486_006588 [Trichoglossum hirsutum]|uniref:Xylanolytic transcriptional activator regulatory domain-containing protein n=1 Tax=Trichoglossum hirsutum TaxID=265104 RepID=A0A9P8L7B5_9PEZI|nr:hypothetical protein GP486_006588 [Trichoglossum hirsutum]